MGNQAKMERADSNSRIRRPLQLSLELASLLGRQGPQPVRAGAAAARARGQGAGPASSGD